MSGWTGLNKEQRAARVREETEGLPIALRQWLCMATDGVGVLGRRRIIADISGHYNKAFAGALERGVSEFSAHSAALESLGDAKAARKRFIRKHLSARDESSILSNLANRNSFQGLEHLVCLPGGIVFTYIGVSTMFDNPVTGVPSLIIGLAYILAEFFLASNRRWQRNREVRTLAQTSQFISVPLMGMLSTLNPDWALFFILIGIGAYCGGFIGAFKWPRTVSEEELQLIGQEYRDWKPSRWSR